MKTAKKDRVPLLQVGELVALLRGSFVEHFPAVSVRLGEELARNRRPRSAAMYEYYNVMCIMRENISALLEAIQRVEKPIWGSQDLEGTHIELR